VRTDVYLYGNAPVYVHEIFGKSRDLSGQNRPLCATIVEILEG
jgi:hypothetical protein